MILGLLLPPVIVQLDFKSKEELQSMPQTEEEHLENQNLDYEDHEKRDPDAEVRAMCFPNHFLLFFCKFCADSQNNIQENENELKCRVFIFHSHSLIK